MISVRQATTGDADELARIDLATWTPLTSPSEPPHDPDSHRFFGERTTPEHVLVAERDGAVAGWLKLTPATPLPSNAHVLMVNGLAVDPAHQGAGVGRALLEAAVQKARERGARKLSLRVLGDNTRARALYERCGFEVEGVLRGEFLLGGRYVDDVSMTRLLT